jgi:hypothetical protein
MVIQLGSARFRLLVRSFGVVELSVSELIGKTAAIGQLLIAYLGKIRGGGGGKMLLAGK